jgi:hypothetical protein
MTTLVFKPDRVAMIREIRERDGDVCAYPGCSETLDFVTNYADLPQDDPRRKFEVTIDHWIPQYFGKSEGWTLDRIWHIDNLRLMTKKCNAKKGDRIPNADGTLPEKPQSSFRFRRQKRAERPEMCFSCDNGHNLFVGEICASCGCDAQRFPRSAHVSFSECEKTGHGPYWCWVCSITPDMRIGATEMMLLGGEGGN